jgi:hypothetical protein
MDLGTERQIVSRFISPEGLLVGVTFTLRCENENSLARSVRANR